MAAYNFKVRFVEPIQAGRKRHTIRADRKDGRVPVPGEPLALFCGMRTRKCFRILPGTVPCTRVQPIAILSSKVTSELGASNVVYVEGLQLAPDECERLAESDGFGTFAEMMQFWAGRLPFAGNIIHWNPEASQ